MTHYAFIDEPRPGAAADYVVRPYWIFVALLLAGAWLAFPWFALNAIALGSPTKNREVGIAAGYFAAATLVALLLLLLMFVGLPVGLARYALLTVVGIKLAAAFSIVVLQSAPYSVRFEGRTPLVHPALIVALGWSLRVLVAPEASSGWARIVEVVLG